MSDQTKIDFQSEDNLWAAQMACNEANSVSEGWQLKHVVPEMAPLYALALRILRTVEKPSDPLLPKAREIVASLDDDETYAMETRNGEHDESFSVRVALAALKEGRGQ